MNEKPQTAEQINLPQTGKIVFVEFDSRKAAPDSQGLFDWTIVALIVICVVILIRIDSLAH